MSRLCEECDQKAAVKYCSSCGQQLCGDCDIRIHNKGKRALHTRNDLAENSQSFSQQLELRKKFEDTEIFCQGELLITLLQRLLQQDKLHSKDLKRMHALAADYYIKEAYKGNLMHDADSFKRLVCDKFQAESGLMPKVEIEELFE